MITHWKQTAIANVDGDKRRFREGFVRMGMVPDPDRFDWDHQYKVMQ